MPSRKADKVCTNKVQKMTQATQPMGGTMLTSDGDMRLKVRQPSRADGVPNGRMLLAYKRDQTQLMAELVMLSWSQEMVVADSNLLGPQEGSLESPTAGMLVVSSAGYLICLSQDLLMVGLFRSARELSSLCPPPTYSEEAQTSVIDLVHWSVGPPG